MADTLYLIDGHAQIYRAYYAPFRELNSPAGEPTKAVHVFWQMMLNLVRDRDPDYLAVTLDVSDETTFRREIYPEYKSNRDAPPEDMGPQFDRIVSMLESAGVPILRRPGFEADDILATLVHELAGTELDLYLVSKDKDLEQLLGDHAFLYDPGKDEVIDAAGLEAKKGYRPDQAVDAQTLMGDSTDNIPGIPGVGPKKAAQLIAKYGTAVAVLEHADELTPKLRDNVLAFKDRIDTTRELVTLRRDVPIEYSLDSFRCALQQWSAILPIFHELGFNRLTDQLISVSGAAKSKDHSVAGPVEKMESEYLLVDTSEKLSNFAKELSRQKRFAFDTETTGVNPVASSLVGLSFSWQSGQAFYLPVRAAVGDVLALHEVRRQIGPILADTKIHKIGHNVKYDLVVLRSEGFEVRGVDFDTMIASFLLEPTRRSHGMNYLSSSLLNHRAIPITDLIGKGKDQTTLDQIDTQRVGEYAAEDADITWRLYELFSREMQSDERTARLFHETEMPLVDVLAAMELAGVALDTGLLVAMSAELADRLEELTRRIHQEAQHEFNIDSTQQLGRVLFDEFGLRVVKRTKTLRSTDADTLEMLATETENPIPGLVLEYRELTKLRSTYTEALPGFICPATGRVHAGFHQTGAITGRLSSSDPNLQNIPIRTELGRRIRGAFVAGREDQVILTADYSQIELRILAHFSQDATLLNAFAQDEDIHRLVAAQVFGVPLDEVQPDQRSRAKAVNFGIIYGQTPFGLARGTGMSLAEARTFIDTYFLRYPGIRLFMDGVIDRARDDGWVETILGRRRPIDGLDSRNRQTVAAAERLAVNTVIQGSAADLIKRAMIAIHRKIVEEERTARMIIQVHDELVFEVSAETVPAEAEMIREEMSRALPLDVPVRVDVNWGSNWLEGK